MTEAREKAAAQEKQTLRRARKLPPKRKQMLRPGRKLLLKRNQLRPRLQLRRVRRLQLKRRLAARKLPLESQKKAAAAAKANAEAHEANKKRQAEAKGQAANKSKKARADAWQPSCGKPRFCGWRRFFQPVGACVRLVLRVVPPQFVSSLRVDPLFRSCSLYSCSCGSSSSQWGGGPGSVRSNKESHVLCLAPLLFASEVFILKPVSKHLRVWRCPLCC